MRHASDRLVESIRHAGAPACVGLDPVLEKLPEVVRARHHEATAAIEEFCLGALDAVGEVVGVVKPQSACFERYGAKGVAVLERVCHAARERGLVVILDAKRGDIGISAEHYAAAAVHAGADWITVNAYLGFDTVEPYLAAGLGVFALVRTSNPRSDEVQGLRLEDGRSVAGMMAQQVATLGARHVGAMGLSDVGAVVGATKASEGKSLRALMPKQVFLVPGYGAQGGTANDVRALLSDSPETGGGVVVNASRSVIYAFKPDEANWKGAVARAALGLVDELRGVIG